VEIPESWRHNLGLKLLAAGLALLLYLHVHGTKTVEREVDLPLRLENLPDSLILLETPPPTARVRVSGPAQELLFLRFVPRAGVQVDLARAHPPAVRRALMPSDVDLGSEDRLVVQGIVEPQAVELAVDRRIDRTLPVRVVFSGQPPAGYLLLSTRADPNKVVCSGPSTRLADLREIATRPVDLAGRRDAFTTRVELAVDPQLVDCNPATVNVECAVEREQQRALVDRPVTVRNPGDGMTVEIRPAQVTVTLSGPQQAVESLDPDDIQVVLDAAALVPGNYQGVPLEPQLPAWAHLDSVVPDSVAVVVRRRAHRR
jgi:hypothetical protein